MTNIERIVAAIRSEPGLSDGELRQRTKVDPHQQVNQICRRLEREGYLHRIARADGRIGNYLSESARSNAHVGESHSGSSSPEVLPPQLAAVSPAIAMNVPTARDTLIILPCSGRKTTGGSSAPGRSILDLLGPALRERLVKARRRVGASAALDETQLLPAWRRYSGTLYRNAGEHLAGAVTAGVPILIVSGAYGVVLVHEHIGLYDRVFSLGDWPDQLLQECLVAAAEALCAQKVIAFCARTTAYAELIRRTPWSKGKIEARLASPNMAGRRGAQALVPQACGQAVGALLSGELNDKWVSTRGVPVRVERVG